VKAVRVSVDTSTGVLYMLIDGARAAFGASSQAPHNADLIIDRDTSGEVVGIRYLCRAAPLAQSFNNPDERLLPVIINAALDDYFWGDSGISLDDECRYLDGEGPDPWTGRTPYLFMLLDGVHFVHVHRAPDVADMFIGRCTGLGVLAQGATEAEAREAIRVAVDAFLMNHPEYAPCPNCGVDFDTTGACHSCAWSVEAWYNAQPFNASSAVQGHSEDSPAR